MPEAYRVRRTCERTPRSYKKLTGSGLSPTGTQHHEARRDDSNNLVSSFLTSSCQLILPASRVSLLPPGEFLGGKVPSLSRTISYPGKWGISVVCARQLTASAWVFFLVRCTMDSHFSVGYPSRRSSAPRPEKSGVFVVRTIQNDRTSDADLSVHFRRDSRSWSAASVFSAGFMIRIRSEDPPGVPYAVLTLGSCASGVPTTS